MNTHAVWSIGCALSFAVGHYTGRESHAALEQQIGRVLAAMSANGPSIQAAEVVTCTNAIDRAALRTEIREALASINGTPAGSPAAIAQSPTPEGIAAASKARALLEQELRRKVWTPDDAMQLRQMLGQVTANTRGEIVSQLLSALNEGRMRYEGKGPPF